MSYPARAEGLVNMIIDAINLDESAVITAAISASGDVLSHSVDVLRTPVFFGIHYFWGLYMFFFKFSLNISTLDESLFIFWFTALGICFNIDLRWPELKFIQCLLILFFVHLTCGFHRTIVFFEIQGIFCNEANMTRWDNDFFSVLLYWSVSGDILISGKNL